MEIVIKKEASLAVLMDVEYIDPEFLILSNMSLQDSLHCPPEVVLDKLAHQITRSPNDLRSHTQRILILIEQNKVVALYGSLIDLFLVLGAKGVALRKRMLLSAKSVLPDPQFDFLWQSLSNGLRTTLCETEQSLLSQGRKNTTPFIDKKILHTERSIHPLEQARSYLEYGQVDEARILLERVIIEEPDVLEYQQDLVEIFQKLKNRTLFISFYQQLLELGITLPLMWQQLAQEFNYEIQA